MPAPVQYHVQRTVSKVSHGNHDSRDAASHVAFNQEAEDTIAHIHRVLTRDARDAPQPYPDTHVAFDSFLQKNNKAQLETGISQPRLGVCFKNVTTWVSSGASHGPVKTLKDALWRTLTGRDLYEWTTSLLGSKPKPESGRPLIQNFSGVVRGGEIMLVLGAPGSGCSTFLRTITNDHSSFLGVTGSLDYSGFTPEEISKHYRGEVSYIPEDDVHFPTLTVRQTLEFALQCKTPKRNRKDIPQYHEMLARVFGISHVLDTLVGNSFIRGVSGGERKRISIVESLAANSSVVAWDNSTRGLDAASALDYTRSLRILTDTCGKATIVSLYQVSDSVFDLSDKVLLIDQGRMIFQGPSHLAKPYFESLGYECQERQTISDFLASVTSISERRFKPGWAIRTPKGSVELEKAFRQSQHFEQLQKSILNYETGLLDQGSDLEDGPASLLNDGSFKRAVQATKSRYVPRSSSFTISFPRQVYLCAKRQWWQLKGHPAPLYIKSISIVINALIIGSMFYAQPATSSGAFSRGGFLFYSAILIGWIQLAELEDAVQGRGIINRQKRFAFVAPSAVSLSQVSIDIWVVLVQAILYSVIAYFLAGMQQSPGAFFIFVLFIYILSICMTAQFRFIGAISPNYEVAIRYCGVFLLIYIIFGGYFMSLEDLMDIAPWFGWIAYVLPITYAYEAMMANEFHGLSLVCSPGSEIPRGLGFSDGTHQTCDIARGFLGSLSLSGDQYLSETFGFVYGHVWRNFGILLLFTIAFIGLTAWSTELFEWAEGGVLPIEYKQTSKSKATKPIVSRDEENLVENDTQGPHIKDEDKRSVVPVNLAATQSTFTWKDVSYTIPYAGGTKTLLNNISGYCAPGEMTALVGSSGAGKTTLLNILAQRQRVGDLTGEVLLSGEQLDSTFQRKIGFCEQTDIHDESSTIREAFELSALLRQHSSISRAEKIEYVQTILEMLDLVEIQDLGIRPYNQVQYIIRSLPLEQKKRTTIGVELCAKGTELLFLDEPTSGLDGQGAMNVLHLLRKLSNAGQAIICTIHQATQQQFTLFDKVLAVNPGGNTFYFGEIGNSGETIFRFFKDHGVKVEVGKNVAEFLIEVGVGVLKSGTHPELDFNEVWRSSAEAGAIRDSIERICQQGPSSKMSKGSGRMRPSSEFSASTWEQTYLLTKRVSRQYWRTPEYPYSRLYASFLHAFLNGFTFFQLGNSIKDMQSRLFSCFLILMLVPEFMNATSMRFIANRDIWESREYPSRIYGWVAFSLSQILAELPYVFIGSLVFFVLFYFPVGLPLGLPAGYTYLMVLLFHLFATSWGQWVGALSKTTNVAANLMPFLVIMCELFNGVLRQHVQMPVVWRYTMYYIAPFTYWIGGILSTVLSGQSVICDQKDFNFFTPPPGQTCGEYASSWVSSTTGYLMDPNSTSVCRYCQYTLADEYLLSLSLDTSKTWPYFSVFLGFVISNMLLVLAFMKLYTWQEFTRKGKR